MGALSELSILEEEENYARMRLEAHRAKAAEEDGSPESEDGHLQELEQELEHLWKQAAERLHHARARHHQQD